MDKKQPKSVIARYLQELEELIGSEASEGDYAYRGQENAEWEVESGAFRRLGKPNLSKENFISYHEKELLEPARMDGYGDGQGRPLYDLELLAILQHHGAATCLIDFTRNFLVAMWFACRSHKKKEEEEERDGKIFILNTSDWKNFLSLERKDLEREVRPILKFQTRDEVPSSKETTTLSLPKPSWWHWSPHGLIQRILKQDSLFIFGQQKIADKLLQEIEIKHGDKDKILEELDRLGVTEKTLFKDLPGFAESHDHNKFLTLGYGDEKYYLRKGNEALQRGDVKGAMADYNEAIKFNSNYVEAYNNRGNIKFLLGDNHGAIADHDWVIKLKPDDAGAYFNRGNAKFDLGDYSGAMADYDRAIELKPHDARAYNNRGVVKADLGDHSGAMADYDRAIELDPDDAVAYTNQGNAKSDLNDSRGAITNHDRAIEIKPDLAVAYFNRGNIKYGLGEYRSAMADYDQAIKLNPDHAEAYYNRGNTKSDLGDHSGAIADFDLAIELKPDYAKAYYNRRLDYASLGDKEMAHRDLLKARELAERSGDDQLLNSIDKVLSESNNGNNNK